MEETPITKSCSSTKSQEIPLNSENLFVVKNSDNSNYKLKIKLNIDGKEQNFFVNLDENINSKTELENLKKQNSELKEIIHFKDEKIEALEKKLEKYSKIEKENEKTFISNNNLKNNNLYDDFNIKAREPVHILNSHTGTVSDIIILKDGRLASCSSDYSIIIYNKSTYNPDLIIKEHSNWVYRIIQLSSGELVSCSYDNKIKLFNIKEKDYEILQILNYHKDGVYKLLELPNKYLASCSADKSIIFYLKDNNEFKKDYQLTLSGNCDNFIQTKENEICYSIRDKNDIYFFDLKERKVKATINNIKQFKYANSEEWFLMISNDLLLVPGDDKIFIVNVNHFKMIRQIDIQGSGFISAGCLLNKNMLITGDHSKALRQWRIEGDNLILISKKENCHEDKIISLLNYGDGHIISGSEDKKIKFW